MARHLLPALCLVAVLTGPALADEVHDLLSDAVPTFQAGDCASAIDRVDSLTIVHPDDARGFSVLGQLCWYAKDRARSEAAFKRVLELDPKHVDARIYLKRLRFVPASFDPPTLLITDDYVLRPITATDAESDHAALMSSVDHLQGVFGPGDTWPEGVTLEENRSVLGWHEEEFADRAGFVYTVRSRFGDRCLGCVYIYPSRRSEYDADVLYWVTADEAEDGGDERLSRHVRFWLETNWPFDAVAYPGRDVDWGVFLETNGG